MIPINQTKFSTETTSGNCFAACIASILEKDINDIPHLDFNESFSEYLERFHKYLESINFLYIECERHGLLNTNFNYINYHLICGKGPRKRNDKNIDHCVIGYKGIIYFDPHPSKEGLLEENENNEYSFGFLIRR